MNMENEIWKNIPGYIGLYQVSNLGRVKSLKFGKERILKQSLMNNGYFFVGIYRDKKLKMVQVHVLMGMAFLGHTPNGNTKVIDHINTIRTDNRLDNLRVVSHRENLSKEKRNNPKYASRFVGVSWHTKAEKWQASIYIQDKQKYIGIFETEKEASNAYQKSLFHYIYGVYPSYWFSHPFQLAA